MTIKLINAVLAVLAGIGIALALYWVLNKLAELLPGHIEERIKPYLYILPAFAAITLYLIYPAILTAELPSDALLAAMDRPWFRALFQIMVFSALLQSGVSAVHGGG